jgi:protein-arginine kinase activator protein McsA
VSKSTTITEDLVKKGVSLANVKLIMDASKDLTFCKHCNTVISEKDGKWFENMWGCKNCMDNYEDRFNDIIKEISKL